MKKKNLETMQAAEKKKHKIPDIKILDLDNSEEQSDNEELFEEPEYVQWDENMESDEDDPDEDIADDVPEKKFRVNMHLVLLAAVIFFFGAIIFRFLNWGELIDQRDIFSDGPGTYEDTYDLILPLLGADGRPITPDDSDGTTIVAFGNGPFADDRNSEDSLANLIADMTGATVYNCSVSGSYLTSEWPYFSAGDRPMDIYTFYWLTLLATGMEVDGNFTQALEVMGENAPPEAEEVYNTIKSIDFNSVDIITIMYDATDYLMGHQLYNSSNLTDTTFFTGNLEAGIEMIQRIYPHIRIIVMSPCYAYGIDDDGNYVSSDIKRYDTGYGEQDVLSSYVIMEATSCSNRQVSFIDHLYGTITEDNAKDYLTDNLHLNVSGRKKVARRFADVLNAKTADE